MSQPAVSRPKNDPKFFYTIGFRLAQAYGLKEQPLDPSKPTRIGWFASNRFPEEIEVYADAIVIKTESKAKHRLVIADEKVSKRVANPR